MGSVVIFDSVEVDIWTFVSAVVRVSAVSIGVSWLLVVKLDALVSIVVLIKVELSDVASVASFDIVEVNIWIDVDVVVDLMIIVVPLPFGWKDLLYNFSFIY